MSVSRFELNPTNLDIGRSRFDRSENYKTTFDAGRLIPFYAEEVLPGDSYKIDVEYLIRQLTPAIPVMDTFYLDVEFFFVPMRQVWEHTKQFFGENDTSAWTQTTEYTIPQALVSTNNVDYTLQDYFGLPNAGTQYYVNALYGRAYYKIWNDWWRDENYMPAASLNITDSNSLITGSFTIGTETFSETGYKQKPLPVSKLHDYFTSVLPQAQKGDPVSIGLAGEAPVTATGQFADGSVTTIIPQFTELNIYGAHESVPTTPMRFYSSTTAPSSGANGVYFYDDTKGGVNLAGESNSTASIQGFQGYTAQTLAAQSRLSGTMNVEGSADLTDATAITINQLRWAIQMQKFYETDARYGTRYNEMLLGHFGVRGPNLELQISEFLGGKRDQIAMDTIIAQSAGTDGTDNTILGQLGGYQNHMGRTGGIVRKSFTEHGYIIGVMCVRTNQSYTQGIPRKFLRKRRFDIYDPKFANIGEQPVLTAEINANSTNGALPTTATAETNLDTIPGTFGYQEAWADYRTGINKITGALRPTTGDLAMWTYAEVLDKETTTASASFMAQGREEVDRTLKVTGEGQQFLIDMNIKVDCIRPMPVYSIPGLMDHH